MKLFYYSYFLVSFLTFLLVSQISYAAVSNPNNVKDTKTKGIVANNALVISGGISLGVYEAGVNHVLVKTSNTIDPKYQLPEIKVVTGSSAGAINALATAIQLCLAEEERASDLYNNIFRDIWINVGEGNLLPNEFTNYEHLELSGLTPFTDKQHIEDGLLSRNAFKGVIESLKKIVETRKATANCNILVGIMVTLAQPKYVKKELVGGNPYSFAKQSYAIPIRVSSVQDNKGDYKIKFYTLPLNELAQHNKTTVERSFINLPSLKTIAGNEINFDSILRAVLASSAFPLAFSPINLGYCLPNHEEFEHKDTICETSEKYNTDLFIDGGYFNNIPIGFASELMSLGLEKEDRTIAQNFIYLDPDNTISEEYEAPKSQPNKLTLSSAISNILPGLGTLRKADVYSDIHTYFQQNSIKDVKNGNTRKYIQTERRAKLTANFLGAFGAFLDPAFREHDYVVGIYDGLRFVSEQACSDEADSLNIIECEVKAFEFYLDVILNKSNFKSESKGVRNSDFLTLIGALICDDITRRANSTHHCLKLSSPWNELVKKYSVQDANSLTHIVYRSLRQLEKNDLNEFLNLLKRERDSYYSANEESANFTFSNQLEYMLVRPDYWEALILKRFMNRLIYLEELDKGEYGLLLRSAYTILPQDKYAAYTIGNMKDPELFEYKYNLIPDHFGIDAVQTGLVVGWSGMPNWDHIVPNYGNVEFGFSIHSQIKDKSEGRVDYVNAWSGLRWNRPKTFLSSYGIALTINRNISNTDVFGNDFMLGAEANVGFLSDKLRLSIGTRDAISNYEGEDWSVRLTFTNIDELVWAFWPKD